jgi:hypothetical protein
MVCLLGEITREGAEYSRIFSPWNILSFRVLL